MIASNEYTHHEEHERIPWNLRMENGPYFSHPDASHLSFYFSFCFYTLAFPRPFVCTFFVGMVCHKRYSIHAISSSIRIYQVLKGYQHLLLTSFINKIVKVVEPRTFRTPLNIFCKEFVWLPIFRRFLCSSE